MSSTRWRFVLTILALSLGTSAHAGQNRSPSQDSYRRIQTHWNARLLWLESQRLYDQDRWPESAALCVEILDEFPETSVSEFAWLRLFVIADNWLHDTREEMLEEQRASQGEKRKSLLGYRWRHLIHWDKKKPIIACEELAIFLLNRIIRSDPKGLRASQSLFLVGSVHFFREHYRLADQSFTHRVESALDKAEQPSRILENSFRLAVISKHLAAHEVKGNVATERKTLQKSQEFIARFSRVYPNEAASVNWNHFLDRQRQAILIRLAEIDLETAESWRRRGDSVVAFLYYEFIVRTYPGTESASEAAKRQKEWWQSNLREP